MFEKLSSLSERTRPPIGAGGGGGGREGGEGGGAKTVEILDLETRDGGGVDNFFSSKSEVLLSFRLRGGIEGNFVNSSKACCFLGDLKKSDGTFCSGQFLTLCNISKIPNGLNTRILMLFTVHIPKCI